MDEILFSAHQEKDVKLLAKGWKNPTSEDSGLWFPWQKTRAIGHIKALESVVTRFVWSPIIWENGERKKVNFLRANLLVLDFDDGKMTVADALGKFYAYKCLVGTTKSHLKDKNGLVCDRFRVVLGLDNVVTDAHQYSDLTKMYAQIFESDLAATDTARCYQPCTSIELIGDWENGKTIYSIPPVKYIPDTYEHSSVRSDGMTPAIAYWQGYPPVGTRNRAAFMAACDLYKRGVHSQDIFILMRPYADQQTFPDSELRSVIISASRGK